MKVYYRNSVIYNSLLVIIMSIISLFFITVVIEQDSLFHWENIKTLSYHYIWHLIISVLSFFFIFMCKKIGIYFFALCGLSYIYFNTLILLNSFNKLSLVFMMFIVTMFFYFIFLLKDEFDRSYIKPYFLNNYVDQSSQLPLEVTIRNKSQNILGFLGHWDQFGCFVYLEQPLKKIDKTVWIDFSYNGRLFQDKAIIASLTRDNKGVGLFIKEKKGIFEEKKFKWKSFVKILYDRGLTPSRIN